MELIDPDKFDKEGEQFKAFAREFKRHVDSTRQALAGGATLSQQEEHLSCHDPWAKLYHPKVVDGILKQASRPATDLIAKPPAPTPPPEPETPTVVDEVEAGESALALENEAKLIAANEALDNEQLIPDDHIEIAEQWVRERVTQRALNAINESLAKLGRRKLDYTDLGVIALIHRKSVLENEGSSPHTRFIGFSEKCNDLIKPLFSGHVKRTLEVLEVLGYTRLVEKPDRRNKKCGRYELLVDILE